LHTQEVPPGALADVSHDFPSAALGKLPIGFFAA
jgi:hypothetical protein